jgi:DNA ligase-1
MSITRRTDGNGDWHSISYVIFDAPTVKGGIFDRLEAATLSLSLCAALNEGSQCFARIHPHVECTGTEHLLEELARVEQLGGEGMMLRHASRAHRGGRSSDLLKVKSFHDDEALVKGYEKGKGKYEGLIGSLLCVLRSGALFKVGSGLTDQLRQYANAPKEGTVISFKYFELTTDGIPKFPTYLRVRPDVSPDEFTK